MGESPTSTIDHVNVSDDELVAAAQRALPAFEHLYRRYVTDVYRYCHRRLSSESDAADATSMVFTKALTNIKHCQRDSFRSWLFTIARNVVIDQYRAANANTTIDAALEIADQRPDPEALAIANDQRSTVDRMLPFLSADQRAIIELRLAGLSANEIAEVLGKSRNAIDQAQFRAVTKLRQLLGQTGSLVEETAS